MWKLKQRAAQALASVTSVKSREELFERFAQALVAFDEIFQSTRLFFPMELAKRVDEYAQSTSAAVTEFQFGLDVLDAGGSRKEEDPYAVADGQKRRLEEVFDQLHVELQKLVGIARRGAGPSPSSMVLIDVRPPFVRRICINFASEGSGSLASVKK